MRIWLCAVMMTTLLLAPSSRAKSPASSFEARMVITGTVELNPDGTVHGYAIDKQNKVPPTVLELIQSTVPRWTFRFAQPPTSVVKESMSLLILAKPVDDKHSSVRLAAVQFDDVSPGTTIEWNNQIAPVYPRVALSGRISGTVYLLLRIDGHGKVMDVATEQVNLGQYTDQVALMDVYRKVLADSVTKVAWQWTFKVPTEGPQAGATSSLVRIPVNFLLSSDPADAKSDRYGRWEVYLPGPRQSVDWLRDLSLLSEVPDITPDGAIHQLGADAQLSSPIAP